MVLWSDDPDYKVEALNELEGASDRATAIVGGSIIEQRTFEVIKARLHDNKNIQEKLFRPSGPLGSFSAKIDLAFLMGIITAKTRKELDTIKDIRNDFAHHLEISSFKYQRISSLCFNLTMFETYIKFVSMEIPEEEIQEAIKRVDPQLLIVISEEDPRTDPKGRFIHSITVFERLLRRKAEQGFTPPTPDL